MKQIFLSIVVAIGVILVVGPGVATAQLSLSTVGPSDGQTFQAQGYPAYPPDRAFVRFEARITGPYLAGDVYAHVSEDPSALSQGSTSGSFPVPIKCRRVGEPEFFGVCTQEILGWIEPGTYYWRPRMLTGVFGTPESFQFGGPWWGEMRSFSVAAVPPPPPVPSLRMTRSQAIRYAKRITQIEVGRRAAYVSCRARSSSRYSCSTQAYRGRAIWALNFLVWHWNDGGSVATTYRVTFKKKYR